MNVFSNPAIINWQISSPRANECMNTESCNLSIDDYLKIANNILESKPLIINLQDYIGNFQNEILEQILKLFNSEKIFIKYEIDVDLVNINVIKAIKGYINVLVIKVYDERCLNRINEIVEVAHGIEIEINYILNSINKDKLQTVLGKLATYTNIKLINITQEKFINPFYDKSHQINKSELNKIMIDITEVATEYLDQVNIVFKDINSELKNLSKNRQIQFVVTIKDNGDIALNEVFNIRKGNALINKINDIWKGYFKDFWFNNNIKNVFLEFNSIDDEAFYYLINTKITTPVNELLD